MESVGNESGDDMDIADTKDHKYVANILADLPLLHSLKDDGDDVLSQNVREEPQDITEGHVEEKKCRVEEEFTKYVTSIDDIRLQDMSLLDEDAAKILQNGIRAVSQRKYKKVQKEYEVYFTETAQDPMCENTIVNYFVKLKDEYSPGYLWCFYSIIKNGISYITNLT